MPGKDVAVKITQQGLEMSPFPPSFGNNPALYASSLAALLAIGTFGLIIARWMIRDLWRDRFTDHPTSLIFCFRAMMMFAGGAAFLRTMPEVAYMTCYGDKTIDPWTIALILSIKRAADTLSLPVVVSWMALLVLIYPFVSVALRSQPAREVRIDPIAFWPRLVRPVVIFLIVVSIAVLMAVAKRSGMQG